MIPPITIEKTDPPAKPWGAIIGAFIAGFLAAIVLLAIADALDQPVNPSYQVHRNT